MRVRILDKMDLHVESSLRDAMLIDRCEEFVGRQKWSLVVDGSGREIDEYDNCNPLYIVVQDISGRHLGSTRILPTIGRTMIHEVFHRMHDGVFRPSVDVWEVTRFFVAGERNRRTAAALMWAGCRFALANGIIAFVGVVSPKVARAYSLIGWRADVFGSGWSPEGEVLCCRWPVTEAICERLMGLSSVTSDTFQVPKVHAKQIIGSFEGDGEILR